MLKYVVLISAALFLNGCASVAKGVAEAFLQPDEEQVRQCRIKGASFDGIYQRLETAPFKPETSTQSMRMLIVHGIGEHPENYSAPLVDSIARELDLNVRSRKQKRIRLRVGAASFVGTLVKKKELGWVLITRFTDDSGSRELLTFEVNWSDYHEEDRKRFVDGDKDVLKLRASINDSVKTYFNQQVVDPVKYIGDTAPQIRSHVREASCWMVSADWDEYPSQSARSDERFLCSTYTAENSARKPLDIIKNDEFVAVTHSLGSRIFLDAFSIPDEDASSSEINPFRRLRNAFSYKKAAVFMLSNQLPLLQMGFNDRKFDGIVVKNDAEGTDGVTNISVPWRNSQRYSGNIPGFDIEGDAVSLCANPKTRRFETLSIVTVNDPNDLLSFSLPEEFKDEYIDWALCPKFTDLTIEVTEPRDVFGLSFADPSAAHGNYWTDPGLVRLLVNGFGKGRESNPVHRRAERSPKFTVKNRSTSIEYNCEGQLFAGDSE